MFKEKYIRDNDLIKPDDDFLERLKDSVAKEEKVVHIGDFVDYENAEQFEQLGEENDVLINIPLNKRKGVRWQRVIAIAACFAVVLTIAFTAGKNNLFGEENIQADMGTFVSEELTESDEIISEVNEDCIKLYNKICDLFENSNAIVYEMDDYKQSESGMEYLQGVKDQCRKLEVQERDEIIGDIVANQYVLTDTIQGWDSITYYMAEFENQSYVVFGICEEQYIYIAEISGLQNMAASE